MKTFSILLTLLIACFSLQAQTSGVEETIRMLEQKEVKAALEKDTTTLKKIWSADYTVNSPVNTIEAGGKSTLDRPVMRRVSYLKFERNIEKVLVKGDVVITMGNELIVDRGKNGEADRTIKRRFSNIWMKQNNEWQVIARHANVICQ
ncbi:MAG TPA: nuclear transport factor 2 family protein [Daejeonella sp.]|nr:nuclear transport factor 2 family protein [Daejeonella sp.]